MLGVFLTEEGGLYRDAPVDTECVILDAYAAIVGWGVIVIALVLEDGGLGEDSKAVGEASWHKELKTLSCLP